jgi:hypothetical protein
MPPTNIFLVGGIFNFQTARRVSWELKVIPLKKGWFRLTGWNRNKKNGNIDE